MSSPASSSTSVPIASISSVSPVHSTTHSTSVPTSPPALSLPTSSSITDSISQLSQTVSTTLSQAIPPLLDHSYSLVKSTSQVFANGLHIGIRYIRTPTNKEGNGETELEPHEVRKGNAAKEELTRLIKIEKEAKVKYLAAQFVTGQAKTAFDKADRQLRTMIDGFIDDKVKRLKERISGRIGDQAISELKGFVHSDDLKRYDKNVNAAVWSVQNMGRDLIQIIKETFSISNHMMDAFTDDVNDAELEKALPNLARVKKEASDALKVYQEAIASEEKFKEEWERTRFGEDQEPVIGKANGKPQPFQMITNHYRLDEGEPLSVEPPVISQPSTSSFPIHEEDEGGYDSDDSSPPDNTSSFFHPTPTKTHFNYKLPYMIPVSGMSFQYPQLNSVFSSPTTAGLGSDTSSLSPQTPSSTLSHPIDLTPPSVNDPDGFSDDDGEYNFRGQLRNMLGEQ